MTVAAVALALVVRRRGGGRADPGTPGRAGRAGRGDAGTPGRRAGTNLRLDSPDPPEGREVPLSATGNPTDENRATRRRFVPPKLRGSRCSGPSAAAAHPLKYACRRWPARRVGATVRSVPNGRPDRPPLKVVVLVVLAAVGVCMIAASMMVASMLGAFGGWPAVIVGFVLLTASLSGLWVIQKARDSTLR